MGVSKQNPSYTFMRHRLPTGDNPQFFYPIAIGYTLFGYYYTRLFCHFFCHKIVYVTERFPLHVCDCLGQVHSCC